METLFPLTFRGPAGTIIIKPNGKDITIKTEGDTITIESGPYSLAQNLVSNRCKVYLPAVSVPQETDGGYELAIGETLISFRPVQLYWRFLTNGAELMFNGNKTDFVPTTEMAAAGAMPTRDYLIPGGRSVVDDDDESLGSMLIAMGYGDDD